MRIDLRSWRPPRNPAGVARIVFVALLVANIVAAWFVWRPLGGSPAELEQQLADLGTHVTQQRKLLERTRSNVAKVELGRGEGDSFMATNFLDEHTAYSTLLGELTTAAKEAKITPKEHSANAEPIEGSDDLSMMTITGNYEGTYADLMEFVHRLDRSPRLLIIEALNATPQQGKGGLLSVNMKIDTFIRGGGAITQ